MKVSTWAEVRRLHEIEKLSKRAIARQVKCSRTIRPIQGRVYQDITYSPGEAIQIDWGDVGSVKINNTIRKVSVVVPGLQFIVAALECILFDVTDSRLDHSLRFRVPYGTSNRFQAVMTT